MIREIDLLAQAAADGFLVVEKDTNRLWSEEELLEVRADRRFLLEDRVMPAGDQLEVSGPYPGCPQQGSSTAAVRAYELIGQTRHFLLYRGPDAS